MDTASALACPDAHQQIGCSLGLMRGDIHCSHAHLQAAGHLEPRSLNLTLYAEEINAIILCLC